MQNDFYDMDVKRQNPNYIPGEISYKNNSPQRMNEIKSNLSEYTKTNPELFKDMDTFRKEFSYDKRSPEQQKVLDDFAKLVIPAKENGFGMYQDESPERMKEIESNLDKYLKEQPELFEDKQKYQEYFHYNERSPLQKAALDQYFKRVQKNKKKNETKEDTSNWDALVGAGSVAEEGTGTPDKKNSEADLFGGMLDEADAANSEEMPKTVQEDAKGKKAKNKEKTKTKTLMSDYFNRKPKQGEFIL